MMQWICMVNAETLSLYNECSHYLLNHASMAGLILITEAEKSDKPLKEPTWQEMLLYESFLYAKDQEAYLVPIVAALHDDSLPVNVI